MVKKGMKILFLIVSVPILLLTALIIFTDLRVRATEKKYPPCGKFIVSHETRLHYVEKGSGRPLVFIHGSYGSLNDFTLSLFEQASQKYRAIAIDRPGHGYSERPSSPMTPTDHARHIHSVLDQLGVRDPILVGHSYGGAVTLAYAVEYPSEVSALVLLGGYVKYFEGPADRIYRIPSWPILGKIFLYALLEPISLFKTPRELAASAFFPNEPHTAYAEVSTALALRPRQFEATAEDIREFSPAMKKLSPEIEKIAVPITIITGDKDIVASPEEHAYPLSKQISHSRPIILSETGHQPGFIKPDEIMRAIESIGV